MNSTRTIATVTGALFLITFIASFPARLVLHAPLLPDPDFILGNGSHAGVSLSALGEFILAMIAVLFGVFTPGSQWQAIANFPEFLWELLLGIYLVIKGFLPAPIATEYARDAGHAPG